MALQIPQIIHFRSVRYVYYPSLVRLECHDANARWTDASGTTQLALCLRFRTQKEQHVFPQGTKESMVTGQGRNCARLENMLHET